MQLLRKVHVLSLRLRWCFAYPERCWECAEVKRLAYGIVVMLAYGGVLESTQGLCGVI